MGCYTLAFACGEERFGDAGVVQDTGLVVHFQMKGREIFFVDFEAEGEGA